VEKSNKYSNEKCAQILVDVEKWSQDCKKQSGYKSLSRDAKKNFCNVTGFFAEMMYGYHLQSPELWTDVALHNILTEVYPYNLMAQASYYEIVEPILTVFLKHLQNKKIVNSDKAQTLLNQLKIAAPEMLRRLKDTNNDLTKQQLLKAIANHPEIDLNSTTTIKDPQKFSELLKEDTEFISLEELGLKKPGRNDPCPCGKGEKYKKCCMSKKVNLYETEEANPSRSNSHVQSNTKPTLDQWTQLYEAAKAIKNIEPWDFMIETDLITIMLPGRKEPIYCSVMGSTEEGCGVNIYPGYESITEFYRLLKSSPEDKFLPLIGLEQTCLTCYFGDRDELTSEDREIIKSLKLRFRGQGEWPYFRSMEQGYFPWQLNSEQADLLIQALQNFAMACTHLDKLEVDFDNNETLLRYYSPERKSWLNRAVKMPPIPEFERQLIVTNEQMLSDLKKQKRNNDQKLEFDMVRLPIPMQDPEEATEEIRPRIPYFIMLVDKTNEQFLDYCLTDSDTPEEDVLEMLIGQIEEEGRPLSINVRDDRANSYIKDFCQKIGVETIEGKGTPTIDKLFETMLKDLLKEAEEAAKKEKEEEDQKRQTE